MSYLVLARKWRPQRFDDLVGQEHVGRTLKNAIDADRVHHAFLFTGARGVGKTSAARIFAKALNCDQGPTPDPCGVCPSCVGITAGNDVDVFEIDGASNTGVDDIRELRDNIRYLPSRSRYKIFIIDEVHMLSINAFNALLKTLEEPPEHAKFIFATTEPQKIPVTILSRCQRFDFRKIPQAKVVARLREIASAESIEISDRSLQWVARNGGGSMRDSLSTLDQVLAFCGNNVKDEEVQALLGAVDRRMLLDLLDAIVRGEGARVLDGIRRIDEQGHSWRHVCHELVDLVRDLVVLVVVPEPGELLDLEESALAELRQLAGRTSLDALQRALTILIQAEAELANAAFPKLILEMALLRLAEMPRAESVQALVDKLDRLEARLAGAPLPAAPSRSENPSVPSAASAPPAQPKTEPAAAPAAASTAPPPEEEPPLPQEEPLPPASESAAPTPTVEGKNWQGLVDELRRKRPSVASHLEHGSLLKLELPQVVIGYPHGSFHLSYWDDPETLESLQGAVGAYFGQDVRVKVEPISPGAEAPPTLAATRQEEQVDREKKLHQEATNHPTVKSALDILGGEVISVVPQENDPHSQDG